MRRIDARTRVYGLIGNPVGHSLGPLMHNHAFEQIGYPGVYAAFRVTDIGAAVAGIRGLNIAGVSVTIPHKQSIMEYLDFFDETAEKIGAVNTVINREGRLKGYNTDCLGAMKALSERVDIRGKQVVIIGAGGSARAIGYGIKSEGAHLTIVNRTPQKGEALAAALDANFHPLKNMADIPCDILINTTPVGMYPDTFKMPVLSDYLKPEMLVMDIIYNPLKTELLKTAEQKGCKTVDGVSMFVYQGAVQFEYWTGAKAPVDLMKQTVYQALSGNENEANA